MNLSESLFTSADISPQLIIMSMWHRWWYLSPEKEWAALHWTSCCTRWERKEAWCVCVCFICVCVCWGQWVLLAHTSGGVGGLTSVLFILTNTFSFSLSPPFHRALRLLHIYVLLCFVVSLPVLVLGAWMRCLGSRNGWRAAAVFSQ